jgi:hypothetical protein
VILLGLYRTYRFHRQLFEKNFHNNCSKAAVIAKILHLFLTSMLYYLGISYDILLRSHFSLYFFGITLFSFLVAGKQLHSY